MNVSPQQKQILSVAITMPGPFKPKQIADEIHLSREIVAQQLRRLVQKKIVIKSDKDATFTIAEDARKQLATPEKPPAGIIPTPNTQQTTTSPTAAGGAKTEPSKTPATEESLGLSPYQHFKSLGIKIGVTAELADVVTDHIFNGGNYRDIKWVYRGLSEMAIRDDIYRRWAGAWASYLQKSMPAGQAEEFKKQAEEAEAETTTAETGKAVGGRDFIVEDGAIEYLGPGIGMFTVDEAIKVAAFASRKKPTSDIAGAIQAAIQSQKTMTITELVDAFTKLQNLQKASTAAGDQPKPSSFVVTINPDGTTNLQEYKSSQPIVIGTPQAKTESKTFAVMPDGQVQALEPGQPIVIKQRSPTFIMQPDGSIVEVKPGQPIVLQQPATQQRQIFVIQQDGSVVEAKPGEPIVLKQDAPEQKPSVFLVKSSGEVVEYDPRKPIVITKQESKGDFPMPIQVVDEKGKPMTMDLNALITWKTYEAEERRADDRAKTLKELIGTAREEMPKLAQALILAFGSRGATAPRPAAAGSAAPQSGGPSVTCTACGAKISLNPAVPIPDTFNCPNCNAPIATRPETKGA